MEILNSNKYGKTDYNKILEFENKYEISIPSEFRDHLLEHNGGRPLPADFDTKDNTSGIHEDFYGLHGGPGYLRLGNNLEAFSERVPASLMPIASDPFGNQICIGISKNGFGKIFFWDHEMEGEDAIEEVALTFAEFLSKLYEWEDPNQSGMDRIIKKGTLSDLREALDAGYAIETEDDCGRTLIERAAIHHRNELIEYLWERGAKLRKALALAEQNAEYFEEHKATVALLKTLFKL